MALEEIILVEESKQEESGISLLLEGVRLKEEVVFISNMCKAEPVLSNSSMPLFIDYKGHRAKAGNLELILSNILSLISINPNYKLKMINHATSDTREIMSSNANMASLTYFINLGDKKF